MSEAKLERNDRVIKRKKSGERVVDIAFSEGITNSRVYSILRRETKTFCYKHNSYFYKSCFRCSINSDRIRYLEKHFDEKDRKTFNTLIKYKSSKDPGFVRALQVAIAILHEKHNLSFSFIGLLLDRNHVTISYHYKRYKNIDV